ncbi:MAG: histidine kinase [Rhodospirillales bacterium]|nr:histidine kinase [Rhodospirillales bacterium]
MFTVAHAEGEDGAKVADTLAHEIAKANSGATLGFVYVTDRLVDSFPAMLETLRRRTGIPHWVGGSGMGVLARGFEYFDRPAAAVMVARLPADGFRVIPSLRARADRLSPEHRKWIEQVSPPFGIVHGDPTNAETPAVIERLSLSIGGSSLGESRGGFLVGALTSSRAANHQVAETITSGGVSGVLFAPDIPVATGLSQGCVPIGPLHVVDECMDNVLVTLDGRLALDVFKEDIGDLAARDLRRIVGHVHAALPVKGSDTGDYVVRNLIGIDPARGWVAIGDVAAHGDSVMFVRRDPDSAKTDLRTMAENLKGRTRSGIKGGVYFSCVARGPNMFGEEGLETAVIRDVLGDIPLVGLYAGGEISNGRIYGYTGVLTLFL